MGSLRLAVLGLGAGLVLAGGCVRTTNKESCSSSAECETGSECSAGTCQPLGTGGSATGGSSSDGGSSPMTGGVPNDSGGSPAGTGGSANETGGTHTGGGSEGGSSAGGMTGGASATGGSGGVTATGGSAATPDLIDDLEDGDGRISSVSGRQGPWHEFNSSDTGAGRSVQPQMGGANGSQFAMHTVGMGYTFAGLGFGLNNSESTPESAQSMAYDASAWTGIAFMVKAGNTASANLRVEAPMRDFVPTERGGTCTTGCWNVYGAGVTGPLTTSWQEVRVSFASMQREMGGTTPPFDATQILSISFKHTGANDSFDFWIDDVRFYKD